MLPGVVNDHHRRCIAHVGDMTSPAGLILCVGSGSFLMWGMTGLVFVLGEDCLLRQASLLTSTGLWIYDFHFDCEFAIFAFYRFCECFEGSGRPYF